MVLTKQDSPYISDTISHHENGLGFRLSTKAGLDCRKSIEGTTKLCESASAQGIAMIGASGAPDRTRLSAYQ